MSIREKLSNPKVGAPVAAGVLLLAVIVYIINSGAPKPFRDISQIWYYDLNTNERFPMDWGENREVPPQPAPSGPLKADIGPLKKGESAGVRLLRFACGECTGEQFDGYLETYTADVFKRQLAGTLDAHEMRAGNFVRALDGDTWHPVDSEEGQKVIYVPAQKCKGKRLMECNVHNP